MAHGKETPRQKMIGMMYLVLMALLALNVSKQVLDAFGVLDTGLVSTIQTLEAANNKVKEDFSNQFQLNEKKVGPWLKMARDVSERADSLVNFIQVKKLNIITRADGKNSPAIEGKNIYSAEIEGKDNTDSPAQVMIGDNNDRAGKELHNMIDNFKEYLITDIVNTDDAEARRESIKSGLNTEPKIGLIHGKTIENKAWEIEHFADLPLAGVITIMSGLQINIRNAESEALIYLYNQIDAGSFKFNRLDATIIPNSNYIIKDNDYKAQVFLAASDTTLDPLIYVTESASPYDSTIDENNVVSYQRKPGLTYETIPVVKNTGKGIYSRRGSSIGTRYWGGIIELKSSDGRTITKPFKQSYLVAAGSVSVAATKMNVFYLGVDNPVDVSVAGVQPDKITIELTNGKATKQGDSYIIRPQRPGNSLVTVYAMIDKVRREMGQKEFRVRIVPDPLAKVNGQKGGVMSKNVLMAQIGVAAEMENFEFDLTFTITQFTVSAVLQGFVRESTSNSNKFTQDQRNIINNLSRGQNIYIQDIKAIGPDGSTRPLSTINFKLN
jgi:gliding motility-associated protein GldM